MSEDHCFLCNAEPADDSAPFTLGNACNSIVYPTTGFPWYRDAWDFGTALTAYRRVGASIVIDGTNWTRRHAPDPNGLEAALQQFGCQGHVRLSLLEDLRHALTEVLRCKIEKEAPNQERPRKCKLTVTIKEPCRIEWDIT